MMQAVPRSRILAYFTYLNVLAFPTVIGLCIQSTLPPMFSRTESMIRYILVLFPVFMMAGRWGQQIWVYRIWRIVRLPFLAFLLCCSSKGFLLDRYM
jgi:hypothetical protein